MKNPTSANTTKRLNVCTEQEVSMKKESANMDIPGCAYFFKQGGVKRETIVIITMEEKSIEARGVKTSNFPMTLMGTGETIQMLDL